MTLGEIITNSSNYDDFSFVYAKKHNDKFLHSSEAVVLVLTEKEMGTNTREIERQKCPGFSYFLEIFIIKEMLLDLKGLAEYSEEKNLIERVIYYAENDA